MWSRNIIRKEAGWGGKRKSCEPNEEITEIGLFALLNAIHALISMVCMCNLLWPFFVLFCFPDSFSRSRSDGVWIMLWVRLSSHGPTVDTCESQHSNMDYVCLCARMCMSMDIYQPKLNSSLLVSLHQMGHARKMLSHVAFHWILCQNV